MVITLPSLFSFSHSLLSIPLFLSPPSLYFSWPLSPLSSPLSLPTLPLLREENQAASSVSRNQKPSFHATLFIHSALHLSPRAGLRLEPCLGSSWLCWRWWVVNITCAWRSAETNHFFECLAISRKCFIFFVLFGEKKVCLLTQTRKA